MSTRRSRRHGRVGAGEVRAGGSTGMRIRLDRPARTPSEVLRLQASYYAMGNSLLERTPPSCRNVLDRCRAFADGMGGIVHYRIRGVVTGVRFYDDGNLCAICVTLPEAMCDEPHHHWERVDSHIWLHAGNMRVGEGRFAPEEGCHELSICIGSVLDFYGESRMYDGEKGVRRHGIGAWYPVSSNLEYVVFHGRRAKRGRVPRQLLSRGVIMTASERAGRWSVFKATEDYMMEDLDLIRSLSSEHRLVLEKGR